MRYFKSLLLSLLFISFYSQGKAQTKTLEDSISEARAKYVELLNLQSKRWKEQKKLFNFRDSLGLKQGLISMSIAPTAGVLNQLRFVFDYRYKKQRWISLSPMAYLGQNYSLSHLPYSYKYSTIYNTTLSGFGIDLMYKRQLKVHAHGRRVMIFSYLTGGVGFHRLNVDYYEQYSEEYKQDGLTYYRLKERPVEDKIKRVDLIGAFGIKAETKANICAAIEIGPMARFSSVKSNATEKIKYESFFLANSHGLTGFDVWLQFSMGFAFLRKVK